MRAKDFTKIMPFVLKRHQKPIKRYLILHHGLMVFFFIGYFVVLAAFTFQNALVSETFVSIIFLLGALYVFICTVLQSRLLSEVQNTLQGILTICFKCKKIRTPGGNSEDPKAWKEIERYISEKADMKFSHGLCPKCFEEEKKYIDKMKGVIKNGI
jgi:hypothetical protein